MKKEMDSIFTTLTSHSGLTIASSHREYMEKLISERLAELDLLPDAYNDLINKNEDELAYLTNAATINETYFFREEKQFDFLKDEYFPRHKSSQLNIWSASCSTGEEPLSILALAKAADIPITLNASDIDTDALDTFKKGVYGQNSFRSDGSKFAPILSSIGNLEGKTLRVEQDILTSIHIFQYNLSSPLPTHIKENSIDIIFMRNVFIYFSQELRIHILEKLSTALKDGGIIMLSINEVGSIEQGLLALKKEHSGSIYYLKKCDRQKDEAKEIKTEKLSLNLPASAQLRHTKTSLSKQKCLRPEIQKIEIYPAGETLNKSIEEIFTDINDCLDSHDVKKARSILLKKAYKPDEMEYKYYFSALIYVEENATEKAISDLEKAVTLNRDFWPALYKLALLQKKLGKNGESKKSFNTCLNSIKKYIQSQKVCYNFLIWQFSPEYFEMLCKNYIKSL